MDNKMLSEALISMLGAGNVRTGELMKTHTTFRIGGAARSEEHTSELQSLV